MKASLLFDVYIIQSIFLFWFAHSFGQQKWYQSLGREHSMKAHTYSSNKWIHSCRSSIKLRQQTAHFSSVEEIKEDVTHHNTVPDTTSKEIIDPKEAVKIFGRLAEKYIMLDPTGGMCCYSACSDCEYRLPDGGYRMAEQSSSRVKWIPCYDYRKFSSSGKEHSSKWSQEIFTSGPAVSEEEFVQRLNQAKYNPPLNGPTVPASAASSIDLILASKLFHILAGQKEKLTKHKMGLKMKQLARGEEGLTWNDFYDGISSHPVN